MLVLAPEPAPCPVGHDKGEVFGACTDCRRFWAQHRAGGVARANGVGFDKGRRQPWKEGWIAADFKIGLAGIEELTG